MVSVNFEEVKAVWIVIKFFKKAFAPCFFGWFFLSELVCQTKDCVTSYPAKNYVPKSTIETLEKGVMHVPS